MLGGQQAALLIDGNYEDAKNNAAAARTSLQVPEPSSPRSLQGQSPMSRQHASEHSAEAHGGTIGASAMLVRWVPPHPWHLFVAHLLAGFPLLAFAGVEAWEAAVTWCMLT